MNKETPPNLEIRVGLVTDIKEVKNSTKLYEETVSFGDDIVSKQIVSGLNGLVNLEDLKNKQFLFLVNMKSSKLQGVRSEGMILCASSDQHKPTPFKVSEDISSGNIVRFEGLKDREIFSKLKGSKISSELEKIKVDAEGFLVFESSSKAFLKENDMVHYIRSESVINGIVR